MRRLAHAMPLALAALFALYGSIAVLLLATINPPFMNPDETAHFARADQVAHGGWVARGDPAAKALIDSNVLEVGRHFVSLASLPMLHFPRALYSPADWGPRMAPAPPNTALYPPTLYLPAAAAIRIGQAAGLTILPTLELARGMMGLASVLIGTIAIALAGPAAVWLFAILTLPMTLSQMAALTQDGPMIALAALAATAFLRLFNPATARKALWLTTLCISLALIAMSRPPYVAFAALPLLVPCVARVWRWAASALIVLLVGAWSVVSVVRTRIDMAHFAQSDARAQAMGLLRAPWQVASIAWTTLDTHGRAYLHEFVGKLGWLNVELPDTYRLAAAAILLLAAICAWRAAKGAWSARRALLLTATVTAAAILMFGLQYLAWTPAGAALVEGMQGRYFLPLALILGTAFIRPQHSGSRAAAILTCLPAAFPLASIAVVLHAILLRYYL